MENFIDNFIDQFEGMTAKLEYTPGEILLSASDANKNIFTVGAYEKLKEMRINRKGVYRVEFQVQAATATAVARIYKNGSGFGQVRNISANQTQTFTEDLQFDNNDLIQIYGYTTADFTGGILRNFRLKVAEIYPATILLE